MVTVSFVLAEKDWEGMLARQLDRIYDPRDSGEFGDIKPAPSPTQFNS